MPSAELQRLCAALTGKPEALDIDEATQVQLVKFAQRHRVDPYLHACTPRGKWHPAAAGMLDQSYQRNAQRVLIAQSWTQRLIAGLAAKGIESRPLKGLVLATLAYARASDRHCGDIDLLVADVAQRGNVQTTLQALGVLEKAMPAARPLRIHQYLAKTDEYFTTDGQRIEVHFLNHREARAIFPASLAFDSGAWEPVALGPLQTHRLHGTPLVLYLLSHGLRQGWLRLKWLLDLHQLTHAFGDKEWSELRAAATHQGMSLDYQTGIGLLHHTFGGAPAPSHGSARSALIQSFCLRWLNDPREPMKLAALKLLKPPYKMLALPGFWPRFSYLSSLVLR